VERVRKFVGTFTRLAHRRRDVVEKLLPKKYARGKAGAARKISGKFEIIRMEIIDAEMQFSFRFTVR